jgi:hypothetical protein
MRMSVRILLVVSLFIGACAGKKHESLTEKQQHEAHDCLFRMQALFTDAEDDFSFPLWFNQNMISEQKISAITRRIYSIEIKGLERQLREKRQYCFNQNGTLRCVVIRHYFDVEEIGIERYDYPNGHDAQGYARYRVVKDTSRLDAFQDVNVPEVKIAHYPVHVGTDILVYRNSRTGRLRHYFPSGKIQKVDSMQAPQVYDEVILGSAFNPIARYILGKDEIKSEFTRYVYSKKTGALARIIFYQGLFTTKRTFEYNAKGKCTGFEDATFHKAKCITNFQTEFTLDNKGNPIKVNTFKRSNEKPTILQTEQIHYEHF